MIVVFGSINVDLVFPVPRLPVVGETVNGATYRILPGGKGANQAVAAARAGALVEMVGAVGADDFGEAAVTALRQESVGVAGIRRVQASTGCAAIGVDTDGNNQILVAAGANGFVADDMNGNLLSADALVLLQMETPSESNWRVIANAKRAGSRVILNAAPASAIPPSVMAQIDILVVNELECVIVARETGLSGSDPGRCARAIMERYGLTVIVTLGAQGALACRPESTLAVPALGLETVDTTGAGDTFCGVLAASLDQGSTLADALVRASFAGSVSCLKMGARGGMPTAVEIDAGLRDPATAAALQPEILT